MINKIKSIIIIAISCPFIIIGQTNMLVTDSINNSYWSSNKSKISIGWQTQYEPIIVKSNVVFSLSYSMSNFYYSPLIVDNQIGLYNEFGINNAELYLEFGPEIRLFKNIYIVPQGRVSFAWVAGVERDGIGFLYSYGGCVGYIQPISDKANLSFEMGARILPIGDNQKIFFAKVGLSFDFF